MKSAVASRPTLTSPSATPGSTGEDDGWVLSLVYDSTGHHSFLAIVPADRFGKEEVRVHLPFHTPIPFHGSFVAA